jgi:hypothetical protein
MDCRASQRNSRLLARGVLLLQACLGVRIDGCASRILFEQPTLPAGLTEIWIQNFPLGQGRIDLSIVRHRGVIDVNVLSRTQGIASS